MSELAQYMSKRLQMEVFDTDYPVGIQATYDWIARLGAFLGQDECVVAAQRQAREELENALEKCGDVLRHQHAVIVLGRRLANSNPHWVLEMAKQVGMHIDGIVFMGNESRNSWEEWLTRWNIEDTLPLFIEKMRMQY